MLHQLIEKSHSSHLHQEFDVKTQKLFHKEFEQYNMESTLQKLLVIIGKRFCFWGELHYIDVSGDAIKTDTR